MGNLKRFNFKLQAILLCIMCGSGIFSSCSSSDDINGGGPEPSIGKNLVLTIDPSDPGTRATNMTSNTTENQINRLTVGIFSSDGKTVRTIQELTSGNGTDPGTFAKPDKSGATKANIVTTSLENGDSILVAVNAPVGKFSGVKTSSDFHAKPLTIDTALVAGSDGKLPSEITTEGTTNIPMYGGSIITSSDNNETFTSSVAVNHQLAKITINSITVDFDQEGSYKAATFQPTSFFLINVANDLMFSDNAWDFAATSASSKYPANQGYQSTKTSDMPGDLTVYPYREYLTTGTLLTADETPVSLYPPLPNSQTGEDGTVTTTKSIEPKNFFYVTPNFNTTQNTKLIIGGLFSADGKAAGVQVYYPVNINWVYNKADKTSGPADNGGAIAKAVYPNKNYTCTITIKTKGSDSPYTPLDPQSVDITVTVQDFQTVNQSTVIE